MGDALINNDSLAMDSKSTVEKDKPLMDSESKTSDKFQQDNLQASSLLQTSNIDIKSATQAQIMAEIQQKYDYLEANQFKYANDDNHALRVPDFKGNMHHNSRSYLLAVGQDPDIYNKIDYNSDVAKQIKTQLEIELKQKMPERGMADLQALEDAEARASKVGLTSKQVMQEIEKNEAYLKDWSSNYSNENFGKLDFKGEFHNRPWEYLSAVAKDPNVYHQIDYDSSIGKEIRQTLTDELKCYVPRGCIPELIEMHQLINGKVDKSITESNLTQSEIMKEIEQKHDYLQHWLENRERQDWGMADFQGVLHDRPHDYLIAVAKDPSVYNKIDYDSEIGKKMRNVLSDELNCSMPHRCFAESVEIHEKYGRNIIKEQEQYYASHARSHGDGHEM